MSEPYLPVPPPEGQSYWDPEPPRCSIEGCREIVDVRHAEGGAWEHEMGYCQFHGLVPTEYGGDSQVPENEREEEDE
jgi:hypothetical protein